MDACNRLRVLSLEQEAVFVGDMNEPGTYRPLRSSERCGRHGRTSEKCEGLRKPLRQKEMYLFGAAEQWKLELGFNAKIVGSCQVGT